MTVARIENVEHLEAMLSEPSEAAIAAMGRLSGDLIVLGAGVVVLAAATFALRARARKP